MPKIQGGDDNIASTVDNVAISLEEVRCNWNDVKKVEEKRKGERKRKELNLENLEES